MKVTFDATYIYFYAETHNVITSYTDDNWMMLFIDSDQNKDTGWEGYDYLVNGQSYQFNYYDSSEYLLRLELDDCQQQYFL